MYVMVRLDMVKRCGDYEKKKDVGLIGIFEIHTSFRFW